MIEEGPPAEDYPPLWRLPSPDVDPAAWLDALKRGPHGWRGALAVAARRWAADALRRAKSRAADRAATRALRPLAGPAGAAAAAARPAAACRPDGGQGPGDGPETGPSGHDSPASPRAESERTAGPSSAPPGSPYSNELECPSCCKQFVSIAALRGHMSRLHGFVARLRHFVFDTYCPCCLLQSWSRERTMHHLQRSRCGEI
eukprot:5031141-Lingulodinium_polyedra.AAC.1